MLEHVRRRVGGDGGFQPAGELLDVVTGGDAGALVVGDGEAAGFEDLKDRCGGALEVALADAFSFAVTEASFEALGDGRSEQSCTRCGRSGLC